MDLKEIVTQPPSNLSHEQTPVGGASSSIPQEESRGLNEMTPEDLDSLKKQVYEYAHKDRWKEAEPIFNDHAEMVRIPLTFDKYTALHVAVETNSISFVNGLVKFMTPQDWEIQNLWENTAFLMAVKLGRSDLVQIMIAKNPNLPLIKSEGSLPVHLAASSSHQSLGHYKIVQDLSSMTLLRKMDSKDIEQLFFLTIEHDMFDMATKVFEESPAQWLAQITDDLAFATWGDEEKQSTALEILLRKPSKELMRYKWGKNRGDISRESLQLLEKLWRKLQTQLRSSTGIYDWIGSRSSVLADALESGNVEALKWLLMNDENLCELPVNSDKQNILHYAIRKRHSSFVHFIFKESLFSYSQLELVDNDGNNILHFAAYPLEIEENSSSLRATTKMTREVAWFKELEKSLPRGLRTMRNNEEKTPKDIFLDKHKDLSREVKDTAKGIADSGMLVAALVATVAFAAAVTVPGNNTGPWFTVFILANAAALFTSSASILSFLSNFTTSRFADSEFVIALHPSLIFGLMLLLISIVTMVISFAAASFLIFEHRSKWAAYVVASMGVFPILLFLLFQFSIFDHFLWSRFYRMSFAQ